jgi:hypothetical protein
MNRRRMLWAGAGVMTIGVFVALAQHALAVEIMPPPAPLPAQTVAALDKAAPSRPSAPQLIPPSHIEPTQAILWQIREICALLKRPGMTVTELAARLGTVTYDWGELSGFSVRPASHYFSEGDVDGYGPDDDPRLHGMADDVRLVLAEPQQLPMSALESAFGKGKRYPPTLSLFFPWRSQPKGPSYCVISAVDDWRSTYGHKKGVAMEVTIQRWSFRLK